MAKLKEIKKSEEYILKRREYEKQYRERLKQNPQKLEALRKKKNEYLKKYRSNLHNKSCNTNSIQETYDLPCILSNYNWDIQNNNYSPKLKFACSYDYSSLQSQKSDLNNKQKENILVKDETKAFDQKKSAVILSQADLENHEKILKRRQYEKAYRDRKKNDESYKERQKEKNRKYLEKYKSEPEFICKRLEYEKKYRDKLRFSRDHGSYNNEIFFD